MRILKIALGLLVIGGGINALMLKRIDRNLEQFEARCTQTCSEQVERTLCASYCHCIVEELEARHPSRHELAAYLGAADRRARENGGEIDDPEVKAVAQQCKERAQS